MYADRLSLMLKTSRQKANMSQKELAKRLNVSVKTIQSWEDGLSSPNIAMTCKWFDAIDIPIYPYFINFIHNKSFDESTCTTEQLKELLNTMINEMPEDQCRKLLYILYGNHGSTPEAILEIVTAYLHLPLNMRINVCQMIYTNYTISKANGSLVNTGNVMPDDEFIHSILRASFDAVINLKHSYTEGSYEDADSKEN